MQTVFCGVTGKLVEDVDPAFLGAQLRELEEKLGEPADFMLIAVPRGRIGDAYERFGSFGVEYR